MEYLKNKQYGEKVSFKDNSGRSRLGTIVSFPFNNTVDIQEEVTRNTFYSVPGTDISTNSNFETR